MVKHKFGQTNNYLKYNFLYKPFNLHKILLNFKLRRYLVESGAGTIFECSQKIERSCTFNKLFQLIFGRKWCRVVPTTYKTIIFPSKSHKLRGYLVVSGAEK